MGVRAVVGFDDDTALRLAWMDRMKGKGLGGCGFRASRRIGVVRGALLVGAVAGLGGTSYCGGFRLRIFWRLE